MGTAATAVEVVDLRKAYRVNGILYPALRGVNLKVGRGEFLSIMGPSGSGKSTLLNLIGALDRPTGGKVYIDGVDIFKLKDDGLAEFRNRKVGFIFQSYNLVMRTTVLRNVELPLTIGGLPPRYRLRKSMDVLRLVGLGDKAFRRPNELSGGEQQRVAIARAIVNEPSIILGDEVTGNLDSKTGMEVVSLLKSINKDLNTTILLVTHDPMVAHATNRIVYLRDGLVQSEEAPHGEAI
ncbi:MAG: ABC transporter ATP-binding protein [Candidatus Bathyarchaeia archaeon]